MARTVTWAQLRELAGFRTDKGCAISLYLNLDPSDAPTPGDVQTRINALLSEAEKTDRSQLAHDAREGLKADVDRIRRWFDDDFEREGAQGLAIFSAGLDNYWSTLMLPARVPDGVRVGRDFHLSPLVPLVARSDGTIVAVVSREQGQLYRLGGGRLHVIADESDEVPGQHDQGGWSQARYQRHIDKIVHEHLKGVAEELDRSRRRMHSPKVVLVCSEEMRSGFTEELSKLFGVFNQLSNAKTQKIAGTGLGLSICKKIIDLHQGEVGAESVPGHGATFYFLLPVQPEGASHGEAGSDRGRREGRGDGAREAVPVAGLRGGDGE
jgi:hypothetical protein